MRFICETSSGGVREQLFTHGEIPGVLWTSEGAAGTCPLILMGHGGGQHKKAPGLVTLARRFVAECGFAVVAADVPGHGDRPGDERYSRIAAENQARVEAGEELAPLIAGFQALVARQTVPEWRTVLDAVRQLGDVALDPIDSDDLRICLVAAIKRWTFRKSTAGITTKLTLKFGQSL
jgi:pimeloyl-ACP methyl ester carboxylesterase